MQYLNYVLKIKNSYNTDRDLYFNKMLFFKNQCFYFLQNKLYCSKEEKDKVIDLLFYDKEYDIELLKLNILSQSQIEIVINNCLLDLDKIVKLLQMNNFNVFNNYRIQAIKNLLLFDDLILDTLNTKKIFFDFNTYNKKHVDYSENELNFIYDELNSEIKKIAAFYIYKYQSPSSELKIKVFQDLSRQYNYIYSLIIDDDYDFNDYERQEIQKSVLKDILKDNLLKSQILKIMKDFSNFMSSQDYLIVFNKFKKPCHVGFLKKILDLNIDEVIKDEILGFIIMCKLTS